MPLSEKYKCILVHIPKCAGTSMESALLMQDPSEVEGGVPKNLFGSSAKLTSVQHWTAAEIKRHLGDKKYEELYKFSFVRNPWDRFVSAVAYSDGGDQLNQPEKQPATQMAFMKALVITVCYLLSKNLGYRLPNNRFIKSLNGKIITRFLTPEGLSETYLREQWKYVLDEDGKSLVDFIGRYEKIEEDWKKVSTSLQVDVPLPKKMVTNHEHYSRYYNFLTRRIVGLIYRKDAKVFGYRFESEK